MGALAGRHHPIAHRAARLAGHAVQQVVCRQRGYFHMQVDAVEQWAAELALVAADLVGCAAAGARGVAQEAAGAGIHGGDELKACWKFALQRRARDADVPAFQRLAQGLQRGAGKLRQLVQKQHAVVRQRDLTRARR